MDRNSVIGLSLIGVIMLVFTFMNKPDEATKTAVKPSTTQHADTKVKVSANQAEAIAAAGDASLRNAFIYGPFAQCVGNDSTTFTLENALMKAQFSAKGGTPTHFTLKNYKTWDGKALELFQSQELGIKIANGSQWIDTRNLVFKAGSASNANKLELVAEGSNNQNIRFTWTLNPSTYLFDWEASVQAPSLSGTKAHLSWVQHTGGKEKNRKNERDNSTICYQDTEAEVNKLNPINNDSLVMPTATRWIGFKQQFFTSTIIPENPFGSGARVSTKAATDADGNKRFSAEAGIASSLQAMRFKLYFGPTQYHLLKDAGYDLQKQIPLGWGIFGWVNKFLVIPVFNFLSNFNLNYGIVILLLTIVIKLLLFPFQFRSYQSQAKMRVLKPELDELNKKYENEDAMAKQQATMALYREAGVNPLGGCLPLLLQLPVLLAMFNFFPNSIELRQKGFLWAEDLSTYDSILNLPFEIPFYGNHISLFALLMTISTIIYTMMNNQISGANNQMPQLKWMMYLMPVIFLFVLNSYASGLNYYYFLANIITFGQQYAFTKLVDEQKIHAKIQANKNKPAGQKSSSFQKKLEEMARKQGYNQGKK